MVSLISFTGKSFPKIKDTSQTKHPYYNEHAVRLNETQLSSFEAININSNSQETRNETQKAFHVKKKFSVKRKDKLSTGKRKKGRPNRRSVKTKVKSETQIKIAKKTKYLHKDDKKCGIIEIAKNVTLNSGMNAGNFKLRGKSNDITHCAKLCCKDQLCDIALIMTGRCYTVQCYSMQDCQSKNVDSKTVDNVIAYINNPSKKLRSDRWYMKQAKHHLQRKSSRKTAVPNPNEGNRCVTCLVARSYKELAGSYKEQS